MKTDADLLLDLSIALQPPPDVPREPSAMELAQLFRAIEPTPLVKRPRRFHMPMLRVPRRVAAFGTVAALATAGTAAAAVGSLPVPRVVRAVAHDVGLPVTAPEVDDVHDAVTRLRRAERSGDDAKIAKEAETLRDKLSRVDEDDKDDVSTEASSALSSADARVREPRPAESGETTTAVSHASQPPGAEGADASPATSSSDASLTHRQWSGPGSSDEGRAPAGDVGPGQEGEPGVVLTQPPAPDEGTQPAGPTSPQPSDDGEVVINDDGGDTGD